MKRMIAACSYYIVTTFKGADNHKLLLFFKVEPRFGMAFRSHVCVFCSLWGFLLETVLIICWIHFLDPTKDIKKERRDGEGPPAAYFPRFGAHPLWQNPHMS